MKLYDVSPECGERKCRVTMTEDLTSPRFIYQHGDNQEAVLLVDRFMVDPNPSEIVCRELRAFAERCHRYEDGEQS